MSAKVTECARAVRPRVARQVQIVLQFVTVFVNVLW